jgi:ABC-type polysaccharide/polyol phosphate export permease
MAVVLPDLAYFVNLGVLLLIFVSPIGFQPEMVPLPFRFVVYANPIYYMVDAFRSSFIGNHPFNWKTLLAYAAFSSVVFVMGSSVFTKLRGSLIDYE